MKREPTPQQRAAIESTLRHVCVDAGAGSGKTTVLVDRVLHLLRDGVPLAHIVAITFTRKAAAEMRERLRREIHNAADLNDPKSMTKWREFEYQVESARITTIDSFCATLLRENALHIGLDPEFTVLAEAETALLRVDTVASALEKLLDRDDAAAHRAAAEYGVAQLQEFLEESVAAPAAFDRAIVEYDGLSAVELAGHWRKQVGEIQRARRAALKMNPEVARLIAAFVTLDGCCTDVTDTREALRLSMIKDLRTIVASGSDDIVSEALERLAHLKFSNTSKKNWSSETAFKQVTGIGDEARAFARNYVDLPLDAEVETRAAQLTLDLLLTHRSASEVYAAAKSARNALDFSDLLALAVHMIESRSDLRSRIARGIRHLLIDEFQDTNHAQLELARRLSRIAREIGADLFVVGDAKQSIYRFRSAEVEVFAEARALADATLPLDENFRSVPEIIEFINDFFEQSGLLHEVESQFHRLHARREPGKHTRIEFLVPPEIDEGKNDNLAAYRDAEADLIASRVAALCGSEAVQIFDKAAKSHRPARFGDVAILLRTRSNAEVYDAALRRASVPSLVVEGQGFYTRQEVLDVHNLFAAALDPWNEFALAAFLRGPLACISDDTLMELTRDRGLADAVMNGAMPDEPTQQRRMLAAVDLLLDVWSRRETPLPSLLRHVLERTGFEAILLPQYHGEQKAGNVRKLVDLAEDFTHTGRASLSAFTSYIATVAKRGLREGDAQPFADAHGAVTLMTVHSAKGLEFPIVILADTASRPPGRGEAICHRHRRYGVAAVTHDELGKSEKTQLGSLLQSTEEAEDTAEEARVLYVAMTRARDHLLISAPPVERDGSWAALFDRHLSLFSRPHGDTINGEGWRAHVLRSSDSNSRSVVTREKSSGTIDLVRLRAAAAPIETRCFPDSPVPVSSVLTRLFGEADSDDDSSDAAYIDREADGPALGTAAHALLEQWDFASEPPIESIIREFCPNLSKRDAYRKSLAAISDSLRISELWSRLSSASVIRREVPFTWRVGNATLRGKVDALIDGNLILDFKTGGFDAHRHARFEAQLQLYSAAAAAAGAPVHEAAVVYLQQCRFVRVDISKQKLAELTRRIAASKETPRAQAGQSRTPLINAPVK